MFIFENVFPDEFFLIIFDEVRIHDLFLLIGCFCLSNRIDLAKKLLYASKQSMNFSFEFNYFGSLIFVLLDSKDQKLIDFIINSLCKSNFFFFEAVSAYISLKPCKLQSLFKKLKMTLSHFTSSVIHQLKFFKKKLLDQLILVRGLLIISSFFPVHLDEFLNRHLQNELGEFHNQISLNSFKCSVDRKALSDAFYPIGLISDSIWSSILEDERFSIFLAN
jgi:hypothetical protein